MNIDFIGQTNLLPDHYMNKIEQLFQYTIEQENIKNDVEITVSFVSNDEIKKLNDQYRQKDSVTDVLSFPLYNTKELNDLDDSIPISLGDIVISLDKAKEQSEEYNHSYIRELCFLSIHGLLHLLGYDHETDEDEKLMFIKQNALLKEFGVER